MKTLFLTMSRITGISNRGIYTDLMRKFRSEGHNIYHNSKGKMQVGNNC